MKKLIIFLILFFETMLCFSAPGDLDPSFGNCGTLEPKLNGEKIKVRSVTVQDDGKILLVGISQNINVVVRYTQEGLIDDSFGINGVVYLNFPINDIYGFFSKNTYTYLLVETTNPMDPGDCCYLRIISLTSNGSFNSSFGGVGWVEYDLINDGFPNSLPTWIGYFTGVNGARIIGANQIVVYGSTYYYNLDNLQSLILKFNLVNGIFLGDYAPSIFSNEQIDEAVNSLISLPSNKIALAMSHYGTNLQQQNDFALAKLSNSGVLDPSFQNGFGNGFILSEFAPNSSSVARTIEVQPDNKLIVGGSSGSSEVIVRFNENGSIDSSFGLNGVLDFPNLSYNVYDAEDRSIIVQNSGKLFVRGISSSSQSVIYRLNSDGSPDTTFGENGLIQGFSDTDKNVKRFFLDLNDKLIVWNFGSYGYSTIQRIETESNPQVPLMSACYKDFGIGYVGTTLTDSILVENIDGPTLSISNITLPQNFGFASNSLLPPFSLSSGDSAFITISCSLNTIGTIEGEAEIFNNANYSPYKLNLTALSAKPEIQPNASFIDFGFMDILAGQTLFNSKKLGITNNGNYDLIINNFSINGSNANNFFVSNSLPITISPQETGEIDVNFFTIVEGSYAAILEIDSNDPINPISSIALEAEVLLVTDSNEKSNSLPTEFTLLPNYPNPFNPSTKITFGVPEESEVRLEIFNILGKKVKILFQGKVKPAFHTFEWNGLDEFGNKVSNGVYFYKLTSKDFIEAKKMLLLK